MMKFDYRHILSLLVVCSAVYSCKLDEIESPDREYYLNLTPEVSMMSGIETKADLLHHDTDITDKSLILFGWENGSYWIKGDTAKYVSGKWTFKNNYKISNRKTYSFLSYANLPSEGAGIDASAVSTGQEIKFTVTDITKAQNDVLFGMDTTSARTSGDVGITYSHPFASVRFKFGNAVGVGDVTAITLTGVYSGGKTTYSTGSSSDANDITVFNWTNLGKANAELSASGFTKSEGDTLATFLVIPQDLSKNYAVVTITSESGETMIKVLDEGSWTAGYTTTYALDKIGTITVGINDKTFTNSGYSKIYVRATMTGGWYVGDDIVAPWTPDSNFENLPGAGWTKSGDYYYYGKELANGNSTSALFTKYNAPASPVTGAQLKLDILVQAIPYSTTKTCQEAFAAL